MKFGMLGWMGLIFLFVSNGAVHAQSCQWRQEGTQGPGWYDAGGGPCNNNAQSAAPTERWAPRWGAIASSAHTGNVGTTAGQSNRGEAKRIALQHCGAKDGIRDCKINLVYANACAAYAWREGKAGISSALSIEEASQKALNACNKEGKECEIIYSECSLPERIQ
jgi:hypothetical protein